ncbi:MAG TPA: hypothetical protein VFD43_00485, partial [Planctomycetota bacterium]|nr:hypothetical protein [Planctomycetota bacterium]
GNSVVTGNLEQISGRSLLSGDAVTLTVLGNAKFTGGSWGAGSSGDSKLDVQGSVTMDAADDVTFTGHKIQCGGNWTSDSTFSPPVGSEVILHGDGEINGLEPGYDPTFYELTIRDGIRTVGSATKLDASYLITIEETGELSLGEKHVEIPGAEVRVEGDLSVGAGGELALGAGVEMSVTESNGSLLLLGDSDTEARVVGASGGGYALTIGTSGGPGMSGELVAENFVFQEMGPDGIVLTSTATVGGLSSGLFSYPSGELGSVLLDLGLTGAHNFHEIKFEDPDGVGTYNAYRSSSSGATGVVTFTDSSGAFSGAGFENDPGVPPPGFIKWVCGSTTISSFTAKGSLTALETALDWTAACEADIDKYILEYRRITDTRLSPSFGFTWFADVAPTGSPYSYPHSGLPGDGMYEYRLSEELATGVVNILAIDATWVGTPIWHIEDVSPGPGDPIGDALAGLTAPYSIVHVFPGIYPGFTIPGGLPSPIHIFAGSVDLPGPGDGFNGVVIDTTNQPIEIVGLPIGASVELSGLQIGSANSPNEGVVVQNCQGVVVLDELTVHGGTGKAGIRVEGSTRTAIQRSSLDGAPGLRLEGGAKAVISRGSLDDIELVGASFLRTCDVGAAPASTVEPGSTLTALAGVMPDIDMPEIVEMQVPFPITLSGTPGQSLYLFAAVGLSYVDAPGNPKLEMVGLINLQGSLLVVLGTIPPAGAVTLNATMPVSTLLLGLPISLQPITRDSATGISRWGNVATFVGLP